MRVIILPATAGLALAIGAGLARGELTGPYHPDDSTLHLWHMDEASVPVTDAITNGTDLTALDNGASLGNESFRGAKSYGTALCTYTGNPAIAPGSGGQGCYLSALPLENGPGDNISMNYVGPSGAFTYEAVVRIDFNPVQNVNGDESGQGHNQFMQLICGDADEAASRVFQFRLVPVGSPGGNTQPMLEFINLNKGVAIQSLTAPIPTNGADAIQLGGWYHVAVSFNGKPDEEDNLKFYWTLLDNSRVVANQIAARHMTHGLADGCRPDFAIGQTGRQSSMTPSPNNNFVGLIDEVRLSGIAREATDMAFTGLPLVEKQPKQVSAKPEEIAQVQAAKPVEVAHREPSPAPGSSSQPAQSLQTVVSSVLSPEPPTLLEGAIVRGPANIRRISLMFSCREDEGNASAILDSLKKHRAKASFFVSSGFLSWPANQIAMENMAAEGHFVGPEADNWYSLMPAPTVPKKLRKQTLQEQVETQMGLLATFGIDRQAVHFFLPVQEQITASSARSAAEYGFTMVAGTPGTLSYAAGTEEGTKGYVSSQTIVESILARERVNKDGLNGFILLFPLDSGEARKDKFSSHLGELLEALQNRGYEFVRVDELLGFTPESQAPQTADAHTTSLP